MKQIWPSRSTSRRSWLFLLTTSRRWRWNRSTIATCAPEAGLSSRIIPLRQALRSRSACPQIPNLWHLLWLASKDGVYRTMARAGGAGLGVFRNGFVAGIHYGTTWEPEPLSTEPSILLFNSLVQSQISLKKQQLRLASV